MSYFKSVKLFLKSESHEFETWVDDTYFNSEYFFFKETCLARFLRDENTLLLSADPLSLTHSAYLKSIASNSGLTSDNLIYVPQFVHKHSLSHKFDEAGLLKAYEYKLNELSELNNEYCKKQFVNCMASLRRLNALKVVDGTNMLKENETRLNDALSGLKNYDAEMLKFIKTHEILDLVDIAFFHFGSYDVSFRKYLRDYFNKTGGLSFLHFDGNVLITDESICGAPKEVMEYDDCIAFMKLWKAGKIKHGMKFGRYTVLGIYNGVLKIGCNKYPAWLFDEFQKMLEKDGLI